MLTSKQKLEYALQLKRLHEIMVVKENLYFAQSNSNHNRAVKNLETLQDRIIENRVKNHIDGNVDLINHKPIVDQVMNTALVNQRKGLSKTSNKKIDKLVDKNIKSYQEIMNNRLKLDAHTLEAKIEKEAKKRKYKNLSDNQLKHKLKEEFKGTTKKRINRIVGDALHTNQCNISFATAQEQGYKYKVWNNGRGKGRVRPWHLATVIDSVELDDYFIVDGEEMMYPGDLNGSPRNVANCRCWLQYTNLTPSNLKTKGTIKISDNVSLTQPNTQRNIKNTKGENKGLVTTIKEDISNRVKTVFDSVSNKISDTFKLSNNKTLSNESYGIPLNNSLSKAEFAVPTEDLSEFGISSKGLKVIQGFQRKRFGSKREYGLAFDEKTGKILTNEFRGVENDVSILSPKKGHSTVHYHTESGFSSLSHGDIRSYLRTPKERVGISVSKKETWLIKQERKFTSKEINKITKDIEQLEKDQLQKMKREYDKEKLKVVDIKNPKERELAQKKLDEYINNEFLDKHNKELGDKILKYTQNIEGLKVKRVMNTVTPKGSIKPLPKIKVDKKSYNLYSKNSVPINSKNKEKFNKKDDKKLNLNLSKNNIKSNKSIPKINENDYVMDNQVGAIDSLRGCDLEVKQINHQKENLYASGFETNAVVEYGDTAHNAIDHYLLTGKVADNFTESQLIKFINNLDSVIDKSPGLVKGTKLFRYGYFDINLNPGDKYTFKDFSSTSYQLRSAEGFNDVERYKLEILAPEGTKGIAMNDKTNFPGTWTKEHEYLLPRNQECIVLDVNHINQTAKILLI